ncbi:MAG: hypothetical protein PW843_06020 [Azospirillaceae bacterium]|nr:hypothetical protein [Azospirillaceae bacterium]
MTPFDWIIVKPPPLPGTGTEAAMLNSLHNLLSVTVVLLLLVPLTDLAMQVLPPVVGALPPLLVGLALIAFLGQVTAAVLRRRR